MKAEFVKVKNEVPPKIHNLLRLADLDSLELEDAQVTLLEELNRFHMSARYLDEKFSLYKIATFEFTSVRIGKVKEFHQWLTSKI